jgi:integrase
VVELSKVPVSQRAELRLKYQNKIAEITKDACIKAFPAHPEKWITFHDLRHSYATYLASRGNNITQVANAIGDTEKTAKEYYTGHLNTDDSVDAIARRLKDDTVTQAANEISPELLALAKAIMEKAGGKND